MEIGAISVADASIGAVARPNKEVTPVKQEKTMTVHETIRKQTEPEEMDKKERISKELAEAEVQRANRKLALYDRRLELSIHEKTGEVMIRVIDALDDSVVREIPSEKTLDMVAGMRELVGMIVDERR